ncbi:unnamed protein product [Sphagnum troendelagicum]|uniref:Pectinesterase n=1 Tax=Sphagnum troendelagicum TaxID=128251 RepID=A0ABP0TQ40_9BRYO
MGKHNFYPFIHQCICMQQRITLLYKAVSLSMISLGKHGHFRSVQEAVNSIPDGNPDKLIIHINAGTYLEKVVVAHNLPYLTFQGAGADVTTITWHDIASDLGSDGQQLTAYNTASVTVFAPHFIARDIAFRNTAPSPPAGTNGKQGAAFRISGDMAAFYSCSFFGGQDTLCDDTGRHYFKNCYIEGSIDFVFGNGQSIYMLSTLVSTAVDYGAFAAQDRQTASESTGFSFMNCTLTGTGYNYLGRAMGPYSRIIYAYSYIDNMLAPGGWDDWDHDTSRDSTVTFGELKCWGPGANQKTRVPWSHEFTEANVQSLYQLSFIDAHEWLTEV